MRRRSERKKSTDVSSPAPTRRSTRRRKSPSLSEAEKTDEMEAELDSSEETRRSRSTRNRTPVKESGGTPAKRKSYRRDASPVAISKIDAIPEEENNGSGTTDRVVVVPVEEPVAQVVKDDREEVQTKPVELVAPVTEVETIEEIEAEEQIEQVKADSPAPVAAVASSPQSQGESKDEEMDVDTSHQRDEKPDRKGRDVEEEDEVVERSVGKPCEVVVEESNDISLMADSPQEEKSSSPASDGEQLEAVQRETEAEGSSEAVVVPADHQGRVEGTEKRKSPTPLEKSDQTPPQYEKNKISRSGGVAAVNTTDNGRTPIATTTRKRKWLTKKCSGSQTLVLAISSDSLKNLIADVHPVPLSDVQLDSSSEIEEVASEREEGEQSPTPERGERRRSPMERSATTATVKRTISVVPERQSGGATVATGVGIDAVQRSPSPALNKTSSVLYITNLVRPFTVLQLKGLLARTGKIVQDDGFWIDRIKSKCYVQYETDDEAVETRHALHGVRWPVSNPKCLNVEFGAKADMERAVESTKEEAPKFGHDNNKDNVVVGTGWSRERGSDLDSKQRLATKPVREWDVGKKDNNLEREKGREASGRELRHSRERELSENRENHKIDKEKLNRSKGRDLRSSSLSPARKLKKKENEPPLRLLDDLFRKTKTTPCIYWLPLTPEQIAEKEAFRQKRIEEHKLRMKQKELERGKDREKERGIGGGSGGGGVGGGGGGGAGVRERERERGGDTHRRNRSSDRRRSRSRDRRRY